MKKKNCKIDIIQIRQPFTMAMLVGSMVLKFRIHINQWSDFFFFAQRWIFFFKKKKISS